MQHFTTKTLEKATKCWIVSYESEISQIIKGFYVMFLSVPNKDSLKLTVQFQEILSPGNI